MLDTNKDGFLDANELKCLLVATLGEEKATDEVIDKYIFQADTDGDGKISFQEWEDS